MHNAYLTYEEYKDFGGTASESAFPILEMKARKRIDFLTDSRVQNMEVVPPAVKLCAASIINMESVVGAEAQIANPVATSFSTDGYSESYGNSLSADAAREQMNKTVREMLYGELDDEGTPLLYRGVRG